MKFTVSWLKKFLDTNATLEDICTALNNLGLEVEEVIDRSAELKNFKIVNIVETSPHPEADRLQICKVNDGKNILQIVCGAANARKGLVVVLAPIGTKMPNNGLIIDLTKIRGVESQGMLCGADELLINGFNSEGIIELDSEKIGADFASEYGLNDPIITLSITPNRADCLGVYGIARDLAAKGLGKLQELKNPDIEFLNDSKNKLDVKIADKNLCKLFLGCHIRGIVNTKSPRWLSNLLNNIGVQSISVIEDTTNYICHSFAQPINAFDQDKLRYNINIRKASRNDQLESSNGKIYSLDENDLVLANTKEVCLLAGIIKANNFVCSEQTQNVFLEAALYDKRHVARSAKKHKIITDSKVRFERHVDGHERLNIFKFACNMIKELCGGQFYNLYQEGKLDDKKEIQFDFDLVQDKLGLRIPDQAIIDILTKLGYKLEFIIDKTYKVIIPSWRDSEIAEDLIEEVIRVYGYDKVGQEHLRYFYSNIDLPKDFLISSKLTSALISRGYYESVTWSFMHDIKASKFSEVIDYLKLMNPISSELNYMRPSILPNLLDSIASNQKNFIKNIKLFEIGPIFDDVNTEKTVLSAVSIGEISFNLPHEKPRTLDIYDIKGDLEYILNVLDIDHSEIDLIHKAELTYFHPNIGASLSYKDKIIGAFGALHPKILKEYDIEGEVFYFELYLDKLDLTYPKAEFIEFTHPPIDRDFAFILDKSINAGDIVKHIKKINLPIKEVKVFDIYSGDQVPESKKSIAISVILQTNTNLNSDQIDRISQEIINSVNKKFDATLRQ